MHLTVTVRPSYQRDLEETYPKLARHLSRLEPELVKQNPSIYELVGRLDQLLYRFEGTPIRDVFLRHRENLQNFYRKVEQNIADWKLAQADGFLYGIEDIFSEIESELD